MMEKLKTYRIFCDGWYYDDPAYPASTRECRSSRPPLIVAVYNGAEFESELAKAGWSRGLAEGQFLCQHKHYHDSRWLGVS